MNTKLAIAVAGIVMIVIGGCKKANPIVGTWKFQISDEMMKNAPTSAKPPVITLELKDDGTFTGSTQADGKSETAEGTYKLEGKELTVTATKENGVAKTNPTPKHMTVSDDFKTMEIPELKGMAKMVKE